MIFIITDVKTSNVIFAQFPYQKFYTTSTLHSLIQHIFISQGFSFEQKEYSILYHVSRPRIMTGIFRSLLCQKYIFRSNYHNT